MSRITRKKLVKGTKLQAQPVDSFQSNVVSGLNQQGISSDNVSKYETVFRLNWFLDQLRWGDDTHYPPDQVKEGTAMGGWEEWWGKGQVYNFPFIMPATQDIWTTQINEQSKYYTLKDITFTIDQGDEPISFLAEDGVLDPDGTEYYEPNTREFDWSFTLTIWSKTPYSVNSSITIWEDQIGSWNIPYTAFAANNMAFNPYVIENLNLLLAPDKSYNATLEFNGVPKQLIIPPSDTAAYYDQLLKNIQISFRISTPARTFDVETGENKTAPQKVQNFPYRYNGGVDGNISINTINPGDPIDDDFQSNIESIDHAFHHKLQGGHNTLWSKPFAEQQTDLAAYDIFSVSLFNNTALMRIGGMDLRYHPYVEKVEVGDPGDRVLHIYSIADRRVIPIYHPFTIHSIYVGWQKRVDLSLYQHNLNQPAGFNGTINAEVVLHSGWRSDRYSTQSIAYWRSDEMTTANVVDAAIDPIIQRNSDHTSGVGEPSIFITQIPLNGSNGQGFFTQGLPTYAGRGIGYNSDDRTYIKDGVTDTFKQPLTRGQEKLLEIRTSFTDLDLTPFPPPNSLKAIPWGNGLSATGLTFYFVCKKSLVKSEW